MRRESKPFGIYLVPVVLVALLAGLFFGHLLRPEERPSYDASYYVQVSETAVEPTPVASASVFSPPVSSGRRKTNVGLLLVVVGVLAFSAIVLGSLLAYFRSQRYKQNAQIAQKGWDDIGKKRVLVIIGIATAVLAVAGLGFFGVPMVKRIGIDWGATVRSLVFWWVVVAAVAISLGLFFFRKRLKELFKNLKSRKERRKEDSVLRVRELVGVRSFLFSARGTKDPQLQRGNLEEAATALSKMDDFKDKVSILAFIEAAQHATEASLRVDNIGAAIGKVVGVINTLRKGSLSEQPSLDRESGTPQPTGSGQEANELPSLDVGRDTSRPRSGEGGDMVQRQPMTWAAALAERDDVVKKQAAALKQWQAALVERDGAITEQANEIKKLRDEVAQKDEEIVRLKADLEEAKKAVPGKVLSLVLPSEIPGPSAMPLTGLSTRDEEGK